MSNSPQNAATFTAPVQVGEVIADKYRVDRVLGEGGMGVVIAVTHLGLGQRFAMKFLLPAVAQMPELVARFTREAQAAVRIHSEHVSRVVDVGVLPSGAPYMLMEYLEGKDLGQVLLERGPLPVEETIDYILQSLEALAEAHSLGIIHRDMKPGNLFLARRPSGQSIVKVLDFGISKVETTVSPALTGTGALIGSPGYMSPEQMVEANTVDRTADVWAIGVVLYELLSGRRPFDADTMPELIATVLAKAHVPLNHIRPEIPAGLSYAVDVCLNKDRAARFQNVGQLANALAPFGPPNTGHLLARITGVLGHSAQSAPSGASISASASSSVGIRPIMLSQPPSPGTFSATSSRLREPPKRFNAVPIVLAVCVIAFLISAGAAITWKVKSARQAAAAQSASALALSASFRLATPSGSAPPLVPVTTASDTGPVTPAPSGAPSADRTNDTSVDAGAPPSDRLATHPTSSNPRPHPSAGAAGGSSSAAASSSAASAASSVAPASSAPKCKTVKYYDDMGEEHFRYDCPKP